MVGRQTDEFRDGGVVERSDRDRVEAEGGGLEHQDTRFDSVEESKHHGCAIAQISHDGYEDLREAPERTDQIGVGGKSPTVVVPQHDRRPGWIHRRGPRESIQVRVAFANRARPLA